jgi:uncharacterized tellurite resistance protein B-like protein
MFRTYPPNSPEAVARVLAMAMITDGEVDDAEIELFDRLALFPMIGLSREAFAQVLSDYCTDLRAAEGGPLAADAAVVDAVIADVDDPRRRLVTCAAMLSVCYADGRFDAAELSVMRRVLTRWNLTVEALQGMDVPPSPSRPRLHGQRPVARYLRRERRWGEDANEGRRREWVMAD